MSARVLAVVVTLSMVAGCSGSPAAPSETPPAPSEPGVFRFDFAHDLQGWVPGVDGYLAQLHPPGPPSYVAEHRPLPSPLDDSRGGLYQFISSAGQLGPGIYMFAKRRVDGLQPQTTYRVRLEVEIATDRPRYCVGAGGPPEALVKVGVFSFEPVVVLNDRGNLYLLENISLRPRYAGGHMVEIGYASTSLDCQFVDGRLLRRWELVVLTTDAPLRDGPALDGQTTTEGSVWLLVGGISGFFGPVYFYFTRIVASFVPQ